MWCKASVNCVESDTCLCLSVLSELGIRYPYYLTVVQQAINCERKNSFVSLAEYTLNNILNNPFNLGGYKPNKIFSASRRIPISEMTANSSVLGTYFFKWWK